MRKEKKSDDIVFTPQQAGKLAVESVEARRAKMPGLPTGIPGLDEHMLPMRHGELIVVEGYTSNGKSMVMSAIANNALQYCGDDDIVVYVSWEQSVEEQTILDISRMSRIDSSAMYRGNINDEDWKRMMKSSIERASQPLWLVGHSENALKRRPRLSMNDVATALEFVKDVQKKNPILIVLDYLQRINRDGEKYSDARIAYMSIVDRIKDMALAFACPTILGVQAGRHVLDRKWKQPTIADGQETSNIEQSSDKFLSVWMPKTSEPLGSNLKVGQETTPVTENLLLVELLKQKYGQAPWLVPLYVKPEVGQMFKMSLSSGTPSF
jgi:replicative DNA helicase